MSFGLNKILKKILPKSLFYRALIIVAAPVVLLQIIITIVFFDSVWIKANKGMTRSLVSEVKTLFDAYRSEETKDINFLRNLYKRNFDFVINIKKDEVIPENKSDRRFSPMDRSLRREMKPVFGNNYWFDTVTYIDLVDLRIQGEGEVIQVFFPKSKIAPSSVRIFVLWITFPSIILIFIAILFLMMKRINKHLNQRSEMLSGISHDLRTPLTRLKLQLAMTDKKDTAKKMASDIDEMEKMLNDYLQYAKSQSEEDYVDVNINECVKSILQNYDGSKYELSSNDSLVIQGRKNLIRRSISNIVENGFAYGNKVFVEVKKSVGTAIIIIEDNGPGIPKKEFENVFKPFYRIDKSRSLNKSGVGLGLSISQDIIKSHGGNIQLDDSKRGGLEVKISFPF